MKRTKFPERQKLVRTKFPKGTRFCYFYLITNLITGKQYVGNRMCKKDPYEDTKYMGSSKHLKLDYQIYGIENFTKTILSRERFIDKYNTHQRESHFMHLYNTLNPNGYNLYDPGKRLGFSMSGMHFSEEHKQKISKAHKGKIVVKSTKEKLRAFNLGKKLSEEIKLKISKSGKGKIHIEKIPGLWRKIALLKVTEEGRQRIGDLNRGKHLSKETKEKISKISKGHINSEESKQKVSNTLKGHATSEETRQKISKANKGRIMSKEILEKIKGNRKNISEETRQKMIESAKKRKPKTKEDIQKWKNSRAKSTYVISEETKRKIGNANRKNIISEEHREKISKANIGKIPWNKGLSTKEIKSHFKKKRKQYIKY